MSALQLVAQSSKVSPSGLEAFYRMEVTDVEFQDDLIGGPNGENLDEAEADEGAEVEAFENEIGEMAQAEVSANEMAFVLKQIQEVTTSEYNLQENEKLEEPPEEEIQEPCNDDLKLPDGDQLASLMAVPADEERQQCPSVGKVCNLPLTLREAMSLSLTRQFSLFFFNVFF